MAEFGELLAELRTDRKMTQKDLASMMHVSIGTISNYEKGVHFPNIEKLLNLADIFQVTTDYLLGRCESNLSADVFSEYIVNDMTIGELIGTLRQLPAGHRRALTLILSDMKLCMAVRQYEKKENQ